jgi:hypothetical protein
MKSSINQINNSTESLHSRLDEVKERILGLEDRTLKYYIQTEKGKIRKNEDSIQDLWGTIE